MLPSTCRVRFEDPHQLHDFHLTVTPDEGFWAGGRFRFHIFVTEDYNMAVSTNSLWKVLCHLLAGFAVFAADGVGYYGSLYFSSM